MKSHLSSRSVMLAVLAGCCLPAAAQAQSLPYGDVGGSSSSGGYGNSGGYSNDTASDADNGNGNANGSGGQQRRERRVQVTPYIEAGQVALARLSPGSDVVTYSTVAAGVDASFRGRNNEGSVSLRYERRFGWGGKVSDGDAVSGLARFSAAVIPQTLKIEAGGIATRSSVQGDGSALSGGAQIGDTISQVYSVYAGPSLSTRVGIASVDAHYRAGYTRVESPNSVTLAPGQTRADIFNDSISHNAAVRVGTRAGDGLPVGVGVGGGWNREDVSNLDQRVDDRHVRGDLTVPLGNSLSVVGGVGYEKVEVSSRDAVRDTVTGDPVIGSDGRYVTDKSKPRTIAYKADGLIWDAGVIYRPSRRTSLEAHVGRRYGSMSYFGSLSYAPSARSSLNLAVYDTVSGFGGMLNNALANLPAQFQTFRNPLNGNVGGCVAGQGEISGGQSTCLTGALGSVRSSVFRSRGVAGAYSVTLGDMQAGFGAGYDRRKFIGAPGTVLAAANGVTEENIWLSAYLSGKVDRNSGYTLSTYANWFQSGDIAAGDVRSFGATAAYYRSITSHLSASAALGIDGAEAERLPDTWSASAQVGVRYSFYA